MSPSSHLRRHRSTAAARVTAVDCSRLGVALSEVTRCGRRGDGGRVRGPGADLEAVGVLPANVQAARVADLGQEHLVRRPVRHGQEVRVELHLGAPVGQRARPEGGRGSARGWMAPMGGRWGRARVYEM